MPQSSNIAVRAVRLEDAAFLSALLNQIIERGGTTAHQKKLSQDEFARMYLENPRTVSCFVACLKDGTRLGFQHLDTNPKLPDDWLDIATFAKIDSPVRGIGTALFDATISAARQANMVAINATIRADNAPGLGYYSKMGFVDYAIIEAVPLADGTPVDRISKKYLLK
ncbi:MAG: GNAT family N-acetyltransferase [Rhizobiaceae bacterium]|nr:GNAT family N-acetyltransferase [Rhizobiaceae bacterium]